MLELAFAAPAKAMDKLKMISIAIDLMITDEAKRHRFLYGEDVEDLIDSFIENSTLLLQSQPIIKASLLRILANFSLVPEETLHIDEKIMGLMNSMIEAGHQDKQAVREVVIELYVPKLIA